MRTAFAAQIERARHLQGVGNEFGSSEDFLRVGRRGLAGDCSGLKFIEAGEREPNGSDGRHLKVVRRATCLQDSAGFARELDSIRKFRPLRDPCRRSPVLGAIRCADGIR